MRWGVGPNQECFISNIPQPPCHLFQPEYLGKDLKDPLVQCSLEILMQSGTQMESIAQ